MTTTSPSTLPAGLWRPARSLWFEPETGADGKPVRPERLRWVHACGQAGPWTTLAASRAGGTAHRKSCKASLEFQGGATYEVQYVGGGWDLYVVVPAGEHASVHSQHNWFMRDSDDDAGFARLVERVRAAGGRVVNAGSPP